jgi:hypothetical protein
LKKLLILLPFFTHAALAQVDPLIHNTDSIKISIETKLDSAKTSVNHRLDSIEASFNNQVDNLKQSYGQTKSKIESLKGNYQSKIDSLSNLRLPAEKFIGKVDSLNNELSKVQQNVITKIDSLKGRITAKIKSLNPPPEVSAKVAGITSSLDKINLQSIDAEVSKLGFVNLNKSLPDLPTSGINTSLPSANLPNVNIPGANVNAPDLGVQEHVGKVNDITGRVGDVQAQVKEVATIEGAEKALENKVSNLDQVKAIDEQATLPVQPPATGDEAKEQLKDLAKKEAVNHFAGKEAAVQQAMDKMSKYKQKYKDVSSIKDLPKKVPNSMKEKSFVERLLPGVALQLFMRENFLLDIAPYVGFRFSERLTAGAGWNQRASFNAEKSHSQTNVYGPRVYGEYKLLKGLSGRLELETMNAYVTQGVNGDFGHREWVPAILAGMKQQYTIYKGLRGTAFVLYNFYNPDYKSPYGDRISARIGFEYLIKKKKRKN